MKLYPSLIASPLLQLDHTIKTLNPVVDGYHLDVMDDHFVPNLTWGAPLMNAISQASIKPVWVHLMVEKPEQWPNRLTLAPDSIVTFHIENKVPREPLIATIRERLWRPSLAISPTTDLTEALPMLSLIDQILIMSVNPGHSGQAFLPTALERAKILFDHRKNHNLSFTIAMDGGINQETIRLINHIGVDEVAVATAIFENSNFVHNVKTLKKSMAP